MENKKTDIFDYLKWRGDLLFTQSEFNEIDALILSIFAYLDFSCVRENEILFFEDAVNYINQMPDKVKYNGPNLIMRSVVELANIAVETERFHDMGVFGFTTKIDEVEEIQFAAVTFILPDRTMFLSFRGTDNTLIGWKEDFNMCFVDGVPSQVAAVQYTENITRRLNMPLRLGGHSKGGNLSIWASTHLSREYQKNILAIYSNDGPGFSEEFFQNDKYLNIREKIHSFVPESSIVGVLMEHDTYITICSSNPSVLQHDPFSWLINRTQFVYDGKRTFSGKQFEKVINSWLHSMSIIEREELVEDIYNLVTSSNAKTLDDLDKSKIRTLFSAQKTFREMGVKKQAQLIKSLSKVFFHGELFSEKQR
ncbi:MAG: Mbeg1-like protein [Blautia hansenii]